MEAGVGAEFGGRLRKLRLSSGLSQTELATPVCTGAYISQLEAGVRRPSERLIRHLSEKLGVDAEELATGRRGVLEPELLLAVQESKVLFYGGDIDQAKTNLEHVVREAKANKLVVAEARAEEALATVHERNGDLAAALAGFQRAQDLLTAEPLAQQAEAVAGIARCIQMEGDVRYGVHVLETYLDRLREQADPHPDALMRTYAALSHAYFGAGYNEKALEASERAQALEPRSDDPQHVACMYVNVSRALMHEKRYGDALIALAHAEDTFRTLDWKVQVARTKINQGIVLVQKEELEAAAAVLNSALGLLAEAPSSFDEAAALTELGKIARRSGDQVAAKEHLNRALKLVDEGDLPQRARIFRELGLSEENPKEAATHLGKAVDLFRAANQTIEVAVTLGKLATLMKDNNDLEAALAAYEQTVEAVEGLTFE